MKKERKKKDTSQGDPFPLNSYEQVGELIGKIINGLLDRGELAGIDRSKAHAIFVGTGYLHNALREARGGKLQMSVFLQDMRSINLDNIPPEQLDRLLQGSEQVQMEVLQKYTTSNNTISAKIKPVMTKEPVPKLNTKLISELSGVARDKVVELVEGENVVIEAEEISDKPRHEWIFSHNKEVRFCNKCLTERVLLQHEDMFSLCSEIPGVE